MTTDVEILSKIIDLGLGGAALYIFYLIITHMNNIHTNERKEENAVWREQVKTMVDRQTELYEKRSEKTDEVLKELTGVIRESKVAIQQEYTKQD